MRLLYFGRLAEIAGTRDLDLALPTEIETVNALIDWLATRSAALGEALRSPTVRAIIDDHYAHGDQPLVGVREIAFIPPVSGG